MDIIINRDLFLDILGKVQGLTGRKSNLAITSCVFLKTTEKGFFIAVTNLETGYEGMFPATIQKEGSIAVSSKKLYEIVREFPSQDIRLNEIENYWIEIGHEKILYHIVGMNPEDFPESPHIGELKTFGMQSHALKKMIERSVVIGPASDEKRAHITGVLLEKIEGGNGGIRMVSTDGSRLSTVDYVFENPVEVSLNESVLVPKRELIEVGKFLDDEGLVEVGLRENHLVFKKKDETIIVRLLEGEYPDYTAILDMEGGHEIKLNRQLFLNMLRRMSIISSDNYRSVIFSFNEGLLRIDSTNPDIGESKEDMKIDFSGESIEVAFNPRFFIDALNVIEEDNIVLRIRDAENPCFVQGEEDKSFLSVVMPMRI
jgi:DNA polymerase-3 subunit beta